MVLAVSEPASERTTLHRYAHRAAYDRPTIDAILDQGIVCHVGLQTDKGFPVVIPLAYGRRRGRRVSARLGGQPPLSRRSHALGGDLHDRHLGRRPGGGPFHVQHRHQLPSVMVIGQATEVNDLDEKRLGLEVVGRAHHSRAEAATPGHPPRKELRSTMLLRLPLTESSAKIRTGWPADEDEDYDLLRSGPA